MWTIFKLITVFSFVFQVCTSVDDRCKEMCSVRRAVASPTFSPRVCRSPNFPCTATPLLESWCWLKLTNSVSHCSQMMPGLPPKWKWSLQRETSTPFPSTAGSLALTCSCSEKEQVCETDAWILHYHITSKMREQTRLIYIFFSVSFENHWWQSSSWQIQQREGDEAERAAV